MTWLKRIFLFGIVNLLIVVTISILTSVLGLQPYLQSGGMDIASLALFCLMWGMGGAFISLALSRIMAKMMMGVHVVEPSDAQFGGLVQRVHYLARQSGLKTMPEVGVYESPELNAFATGPTKNRALVAVSTGLLNRMDRDAVDGVLGHEIAHIANGDMVTMTLVQGIVNAFVMFIARIIAFAVGNFVKEDGLRYIVRFAVTIVLEIGLSFLGMIVVGYFSRMREYRADNGGAKLAGREKMIRALESLKAAYEIKDDNQPESLATLKISGKSGGLMAMMSTHPPLDERIARLRSAPII
jgi:heat shock protein HtpX